MYFKLSKSYLNGLDLILSTRVLKPMEEIFFKKKKEKNSSISKIRYTVLYYCVVSVKQFAL